MLKNQHRAFVPTLTVKLLMFAYALPAFVALCVPSSANVLWLKLIQTRKWLKFLDLVTKTSG